MKHDDPGGSLILKGKGEKERSVKRKLSFETDCLIPVHIRSELIVWEGVFSGFKSETQRQDGEDSQCLWLMTSKRGKSVKEANATMEDCPLVRSSSKERKRLLNRIEGETHLS